MTENEKLRALLAEARVITQDSLDSNTTGFDEEFKVCDCASCERYRSIIKRIDAALAEPGADYQRERDEARARLADERQNYADAIAERNKAETRDEAARALLSALCAEFECAVAHADWRAAGSQGMSVPFTGDFASATQLPSVVGRMRWWAREMRKIIGEDKP
jgi:multidrug efflux pump subunit AcrA (membrane-fusion protein)